MVIYNHKFVLVWSRVGFTLFLSIILTSQLFAKQPRVPTDDGEILESLATSYSTSPNMVETQTLHIMREQVKRSPENVKLTTQLAKAYIEIARINTDVRYYGYAQAVLKPWWNKQNPPSEVLLIRATINQQKHDYENALDDLKSLIKRQPKNTQAWLTLSIIQQVQGDYKSARASCSALSRSNSSWLSTLCYSQILAFTGSGERAFTMQRLIALQMDKSRPDLLQWVLGISAETALRIGNNKDAEKLFKRALALPIRDAYLLRVYCDFLLSAGRTKDVLSLLQDEEADTALLLRLAIATERSKYPEAKKYKRLIESRFREASLRGSKWHERDEALYHLEFNKDLSKALKLARDNWLIQKEPDDALILLRLAIANNSEPEIQLIRNWLENTQLQDIRLYDLLEDYQNV